MDLVSKYQGYVERVLRNDNSDSSQDSYIERLLDRISDGVLAEDRRNAMAELQSVVTESHSAQLAFGARGFQVLLKVLKEERDDVETVRGALETIVCALTPLDHAQAPKNEVQPALMNSDLLSAEVANISLLLSLLSEEDFYVRYYTLQILTALLNNSPNRLQEAILMIPRGITGLMDMLMDREVIRNEALLLLTYLTREAEEIQKIVVFEGAFEKIFSIIKEEGGSDGGIVVQVSQFMHMPRRIHMEAALRILKYLKNDPGLGILYKSSGKLCIEGFVDADWASCVVDRNFTSGWCIFIGGNLVSWRSKKQAVVARSSAEAEFRAVALGICELLWIRRVLSELKQPMAGPTRLYCDSKFAISIANNPVQHDRTKHVEIDKHFIKEKLEDGSLCLIYVPTHLQVADILTKGLPKTQIQFCISKLGLSNIYKPA